MNGETGFRRTDHHITDDNGQDVILGLSSDGRAGRHLPGYASYNDAVVYTRDRLSVTVYNVYRENQWSAGPRN